MAHSMPVKILFFSLFFHCASCHAIDFKFQDATDFATLDPFESVEAFEANYRKYTQDCLDHTFGGTADVCNRSRRRGAGQAGYGAFDHSCLIEKPFKLKALAGGIRARLHEQQAD